MKKHIIFIGDDGEYNRIAKPLKNIESINFEQAKTKIKANFGEITYLAKNVKGNWKYLPFEIICDEERMLINKPPVLHNGLQFIYGNVIVAKYDAEDKKWNGLNDKEVEELCNYLEQNLQNDIQLRPLKLLNKKQEKQMEI